MSEELPLDDDFEAEYTNLKKKRTINYIILKVDGGKIRIQSTGNVDSLPGLCNKLLDDIHSCFVVYSLQGESEDGLIRTERIFTITYTPTLAKPDEKLMYEMQKGKQIAKATKGSIEVHVNTKEELRRRINGVSFGASKAKKDESDDDDNGKDWMDD